MAEPDAWDAEDFEPELPSKQKEGDKWAGEDEDDAARGDWEENDEEEGEDKKDSETQAYQRPKKKPLVERLAEKEAQEKKEQEEKKAKKKEQKDMTAEEKQVEKERLRKLQEQQSLSLAKGLFDNNTESVSLDQMTPLTEAEFDKFEEAIKNKVLFFEDNQHYPAFVLQLINDLSLTLGVEEVKKLGVSVNSIYHEKERQRKEAEKKKKKKNKASIKMERAGELDLLGDAAGGGGSYYGDDDFI